MIRKSISLTLSTDELNEAIFNYLKEKNISVPKNAVVELGQDDIDPYVIVSYTEDTDKTKDLEDDHSNENHYDEQKDVVKEILNIDSQPLPIRNAYSFLRSINYFDRKVTMDIINENKDAIDGTMNLIKIIAKNK